MQATEQRCYDLKEFRALENAGEKIVEGHAAVFSKRTNIGNSFYEIIESRAFDGCDLSDVALFINHDMSRLPLARTQSGTLTLSVDNIGLAIRAKLDVENPDAKALYSAVSRRDAVGMSFSFSVDGEEWQDLEAEMPTRIIKRFKKIYECSVANYPAYEDTDIHARAKQTLTNARKELEKMTYEEFMKQFEKADERTARENASKGLMPDGVTIIPAEFRDMVPAKFYTVQVPASQPPKYIPGKGFISAQERNNQFDTEVMNQRVQAGQDLKERRAVVSPFDAFGELRTITLEPPQGQSATIVAPQYSSESVIPSFNTVSSFLDSVQRLSLPGGDSFSQPYVTGIDIAGYSTEGANAAEAETQFDFAVLTRCKVSAYAELTEEIEKLPAAPYADIVFQNIRTSMRQLLSKEILLGKGIEDDKPRIVGIFSDKAKAIDPATDLSISAITDTTLDEIVFNYGGSEDVSPAVLLLSKLDLLSFSKVRTSTKQKFYEIQFTDGNSGTISGVPFIINSNCKSLTAPTTETGDYCMAYGSPSNYLLVEFSDLIVKRSDDFKFRSGTTCFKGSVHCAGNVVKRNGFLRVRKS